MFFGKVPWDIYCNMDGIYFGLRTIVYSEVTTTFAVEHTSHGRVPVSGGEGGAGALATQPPSHPATQPATLSPSHPTV